MATDQTSQILTRTVQTYEEYNEALASVNGRLVLAGREKAPWCHETLSFDATVLQVSQEGAAGFYEGEGIPDHVTIALSLPAPCWIRVNGGVIDSRCLLMIRSGDAVSSYGTDVSRYAALVIPVERFVELVGQLDPAQIERLMYGADRPGISAADWKLLVGLVNRLFAEAAKGDVLSHRAVQQAVVEDLIGAFVDAVARSSDRPSPTGRPQAPRPHIVARIREFLDSPSSSAYSVAEMAGHAEVSLRTLRRVVKEQFGVAPKQLLTLRQLHDVRTALERASLCQTVSSIAASHGVWELGRFAQRYRELYGENPSATLAAPPAATARPRLVRI